MSLANRYADVTGVAGSEENFASESFGRTGTSGIGQPEPPFPERPDEVVEPDLPVVVVADLQVLARRVDASRRVELGGEDPQIDVREEAAQHQQAVGFLDEPRDLLLAHAPLVDADEQGVHLGDDALAQDRRRDRETRLLGQRDHLVLEPEAVDLDVGQDHRPGRRGEHRGGLVDRLAEGVGVAGRDALLRPVGHDLPLVDHVAGDLDVDRPLVPLGGGQHAVDLREGGHRVGQDRRGDRQLLHHLELGLEPLDLVVQQRVPLPLVHAGGASQDDHRRLLRVCPGDAVAEAQAADAIGDGHAADAVDPGVGVGREPGRVLLGHAHQLDRARLDHLVEAEDVVPRDAEHVPHADGA